MDITFSIIPETKPKVAKSYDVWNNEWKYAIATVIVDKGGIIRYHHKAFDDYDRPSTSQVIKKLKEINSTEAGTTSENGAPKAEKNNKNIVIDGNLDDWPTEVVTVSDPQEDVSLSAKDKGGVDLKAVRTFMDDNYLYAAVQIYGTFEPSLRRNCFIALDFDKDKQDEYEFGFRPVGYSWVLDHRIHKNNSKADDAQGVMAAGGDDTIELMIPRKNYEIPSSIMIYCRVTEGGPTVDKTDWFIVDAKSGTTP